MKKIGTTLMVTLLIAVLAVPAFARGRGWGMGGGSCWQNERVDRDFAPGQRGRLSEDDQEFYDETAGLRNKIWSKEAELNALLNGSNPDRERLRGIQKELSDLYAKLDEKRLNYQLENRNRFPENRYGRGYDRDYYGRHMRGYGSHMGYGHMGGYGFGMGWNSMHNIF